MAGDSEGNAQKRSRKPVELPENIWLEALKSLRCTKWSKMRFLTRKLSGLVEENILRLPMAIINSVEMRLERRFFLNEREEIKIIASDAPISPNQKIRWFKNRGITFYPPADIELNNAIIGIDFQEDDEDNSVDLCIRGPNQKEVLTQNEQPFPWFFGQVYKTEVLFYAEFRPHHNPYSWPSMAYFLKMLYDQSTFVKTLSMYALDNKLKDILFTGEEERYIRCGTFILQMATYRELRESLSWLEQNVQADTVDFVKCYSNLIDYSDREDCNVINNFIFGASWISANQVVNLARIEVEVLEDFFRTLIKKFQTVVAAQSTFPIIRFKGGRFIGSREDYALKKILLSGKEELEDSENDKVLESDDESEDSEDDIYETYTISNGSHRMRVVFVKARLRPGRSATGRYPTDFNIRVTVKGIKRNAIQQV